MAIEKIRLADGTEINVEEWLDWPLFSSALGQGNIAGPVGRGGEVRLFTYVVGDRIPTMGTPAGGPFVAGQTDTNQVVRGKINHDEGYICFGMTYEAFALAAAPADGEDVSAAPDPVLSGINLRRLQRDMLLELYVGANITKPQASAPLEYYGQGAGSVVYAPGGSLTIVGGSIGLDYGTGGAISPENQRRWHLPIKIDADRDIYARLAAPGGDIDGLDQSWKLKVYMIGLKRRPVA